ncbi:MAG TPA: lysophospholipid acyltransferase family protein [Thermoanaerobaculia bacterium]|nr:lysophospholipid acyltransferase family protein [Thermoanaerobaculia bacterium]
MSRRRKNRLLQRIEYLAYRLVAARARKASAASLWRWGARIGSLTRLFARRRHRIAVENFRASFPERTDAEAVIRECWRHMGREALTTIKMQKLAPEEIGARCDFAGVEHVREALGRGRGLLLITAHFGSWETAGLAVTAIAGPVTTVARALDNELLEADLVRVRSRTGATVVDRRSAARALLKTLSGNGVAAVLPDQAVLPREGVLVPFLNRPAWTTDAPAKLAARLGSTIVFVFCIGDATGRYRFEFEDPIHVHQLSEEEKQPVPLTTRINDILSRRIAARPELWLWMHDRWKGTAAGRSELMHGE